MKSFKVIGWNTSMKIFSFTKLQIQLANLLLKEEKVSTSKVLGVKTSLFNFNDKVDAI
jgi:hypothetical protein